MTGADDIPGPAPAVGETEALRVSVWAYPSETRMEAEARALVVWARVRDAAGCVSAEDAGSVTWDELAPGHAVAHVRAKVRRLR